MSKELEDLQIAEALARHRAVAMAARHLDTRASVITEKDLLAGYGRPDRNWGYHISEWCGPPEE